jgi:hypothetical protein
LQLLHDDAKVGYLVSAGFVPAEACLLITCIAGMSITLDDVKIDFCFYLLNLAVIFV